MDTDQLWQQIIGRSHFRLSTFNREAVNVENRTVDLTFASETPIERFWGIEILDHRPEMVNLQRWLNKPPFLENHRERRGVIENGAIVDGKLIGTARLSRNTAAEDLLRDIADGIAVHTSTGYIVHDAREMKPEEMSEELKQMCLEKGIKAYRCKWEPLEGSSVNIPADITVGLDKRSLEYYDLDDISSITHVVSAVRDFKQNANTQPQPTIKGGSEMEHELTQEQKDKLELDRKTEIEAVGKSFAERITGGKRVMDQLVKDAIDLRQSAELFRGIIFTRVSDDKPLEDIATDLDLSEQDKKRYSLSRAILSLADPREKADFEWECSRAIETALAKQGYPMKRRGIYIPFDIQNRQIPTIPDHIARHLTDILRRNGINIGTRDLNVGTATAGGNLVATNLLASSFIELLRNKALFLQLGVQTLPGLVGNIAIPKLTAAATAYWVAEGGDVTESQQTFGQVTMSPKTIGALTEFTRQLLMQSTPAVDGIVQMDLVRVLAIGIDLAIPHGTGANNQPTGIFNTSGVGSVNGASFGWPAAVEFETDVAAANGDVPTMAFCTNATVRGALKTREKVSGYPLFLIGENGEMNGYPVHVTNQIATNNILFGDHAQATLGLWGVLDLMIDPYTKSASGGIRVVALQSVDLAVRQAAAFSVCTTFS